MRLLKDEDIGDDVVFEEDSAESLQILKDNEFLSIFSGARSGEFWKKVRNVQTCLRSKTGVGKPIIINFRANPAVKSTEKNQS